MLKTVKIIATTCTLFTSFVCVADPLAGGDAKIGRALVEKNCVACHVRLVGGDGSEIYTRASRKVSSVQKLLAQIQLCNTELGTQWFPEEEVHAAAYLNQTFYKLKY